jgi:hypothetical protein
VTFSGGGGSGAAAYATVGSGTTIKSIGSASERSIAFQGPSGFDILQLDGSASLTSQETIRIQPTPFGRTNIVAVGGANSQMWLSANGTGYINLSTNGTSLTTQARVAHTASAVNFVQVTGAATGGGPVISTQGSDANVRMVFNSKGSSSGIDLTMNNSRQVFIGTNGSAVNHWLMGGSTAGNAPVFSVAGSDTNIDLALTPKGTGLVRFGTYTAGALSIAGYIEIRDAGGTIRRLAVVA